MDIYNPSEVKKTAVRRLRDVQQGKKVAAVYAGLTLGLSALVVLLTLVLELLIDQSGGIVTGTTVVSKKKKRSVK